MGKHIQGKNKVKYYAQELQENTYNLTRMNLVMRGIIPQNIVTRCADTLEEDWPMYEEGSEITKLLAVDAVVSNPPYSQHWDLAANAGRPCRSTHRQRVCHPWVGVVNQEELNTWDTSHKMKRASNEQS